MPRFVDRTGEESLSLQGDLMRIIAYRGSHDIDVLFVKSGYIARSKCYTDFKSGLIADKSIKRRVVSPNPSNSRRNYFIGRSYYNKLYGMHMTIIDYKTANDITVKFEDGYVKESVSLDSLKNGTTLRDDYVRQLDENNHVSYVKISSLINNMVVNTESCGKACLVGWENYNNVTVKFEDGTEVKCNFGRFRKGLVSNPNLATVRVGETKINNKGLKMRIIAYRGCNDIDVEFEDGSVAYNVSYYSFSNGRLRKPFNASNYIGKVYNDWKIISLSSAKDVTAECLCCGRKYDNLDLYSMLSGKSRRCASCSATFARHKYWGTEVRTNVLGSVVGDYRVEKRVSANSWVIRCVHCSSERNVCSDTLFKNGNNLKCKCQVGIKYDGLVFSTVRDLYNYLVKVYKEGAIGYVTLCRLVDEGDFAKIKEMCENKSTFGYSYSKNHIGETVIMSNGQSATIVDMTNCHDITVKFEDGTVVNGQYRNFKRGVLQNPNLMLVSSKSRPCVVVSGSKVGSFDVLDFAYRLKDAKDVFYICRCRCCGCKDILSPGQMLEHKCSSE